MINRTLIKASIAGSIIVTVAIIILMSHFFSQNKSEVSGADKGNHTGDFGRDVHIALVKPTFTDAAYKYNGFYEFYKLHDNANPYENISSDLRLLKVKVARSPGQATSGSPYALLSLLREIKWFTPESNITTLSDQDMDRGKIFQKDGVNAYDVIVLGHQEYVTQKEYDNLRLFVHNGGTMIVLDGNIFYAEVSYDRATDTIQLVKGHGWAFNGQSAWKSVLERWENETREWVGSNYLCSKCSVTLGNNPFGYRHHEEQYVNNPNDTILLNYNVTITGWKKVARSPVVATYELNYGKGKVIVLGIYSDDVIFNGKFDTYFDSLLLKYALHEKRD